jgi:hypothetical protein
MCTRDKQLTHFMTLKQFLRSDIARWNLWLRDMIHWGPTLADEMEFKTNF